MSTLLTQPAASFAPKPNLSTTLTCKYNKPNQSRKLPLQLTIITSQYLCQFHHYHHGSSDSSNIPKPSSEFINRPVLSVHCFHPIPVTGDPIPQRPQLHASPTPPSSPRPHQVPNRVASVHQTPHLLCRASSSVGVSARRHCRHCISLLSPCSIP
jgi:hypothetical protein